MRGQGFNSLGLQKFSKIFISKWVSRTHCHVSKMGPEVGPTATSPKWVRRWAPLPRQHVGPTATSPKWVQQWGPLPRQHVGPTATSPNWVQQWGPLPRQHVGPTATSPKWVQQWGPLPRQHVGPTATSAKMGPAVGPTATSARGTHCHVSKNGSSNVYCYNATLQTPIMQRRLSSVAEDRKPRVYCNTFHATLGISVAYEHLWCSVTFAFFFYFSCSQWQDD